MAESKTQCKKHISSIIKDENKETKCKHQTNYKKKQIKKVEKIEEIKEDSKCKFQGKSQSKCKKNVQIKLEKENSKEESKESEESEELEEKSKELEEEELKELEDSEEKSKESEEESEEKCKEKSKCKKHKFTDLEFEGKFNECKSKFRDVDWNGKVKECNNQFGEFKFKEGRKYNSLSRSCDSNGKFNESQIKPIDLTKWAKASWNWDNGFKDNIDRCWGRNIGFKRQEKFDDVEEGFKIEDEEVKKLNERDARYNSRRYY